MTARTPSWLVERLHAGDLPPGEAEAVRARLEAEGGLGRLAALDADDAAFAAAHPPGPALGEIRRRAGLLGPSRAAARRRLLVPALAAAAAAVVAVVLLPRQPELDVRLKGLAPHLEVYRQRPGGEPEALAAGAAVRAGDVLQLSYVAASAAYGVVVSVDGRGAVTLHLPEGGGRAVALRRGGAVALAHSYQLDDAPGFERFFLVTGRAPFDASAVVEAARRIAALGAAETAPLDLPAELAQQAVLLRKKG